MGRSKIEYCDNTWNPITGCLHQGECKKCRGRTFAMTLCGDTRWNKNRTDLYRKEGNVYVLDNEFYRAEGKKVLMPFGYEPTIHRFRMDHIRYVTGCKLYVGSAAEMFGPWIEDKWLAQIFQTAASYPQHVYMFLTNYPERYTDLQQKGIIDKAAKNIWYGAYSWGGKAVFPQNLPEGAHTYMYVHVNDLPVGYTNRKPEWIILDRHRFDKVLLPDVQTRIQHLVEACEKQGIKLFMTKHIRSLAREEDIRMEFPSSMENYLWEHGMAGKNKERYCTRCNVCKKESRKKNMYPMNTIIGGVHKTIGYVCPDCAGALELKYGFNYSNGEDTENEEAKLQKK